MCVSGVKRPGDTESVTVTFDVAAEVSGEQRSGASRFDTMPNRHRQTGAIGLRRVPRAVGSTQQKSSIVSTLADRRRRKFLGAADPSASKEP
jgi:hypothetical protein